MMTTDRRSEVAFADDELALASCILGDGHTNPTGTVLCRNEPLYATLDERITPNSKGDRKAWKSFEHYKVFRGDPASALSVLPFAGRFWELEPHHYYAEFNSLRSGTSGWTGLNARAFPFGEPGMPIIGLPSWNTGVDGPGFIPLPEGLDALVQRSLNAMLPGIKQEMSLINTIIELRDFSSLPRTISSIAETTARFSLRRPGTLRELLRAGADSYLQYAFNFRPLLSDIRGLATALLTLEARLRALINGAGKVRVRHFSYAWREHTDASDDSDAYFLTKVPDFPAAFRQSTAYYLHRDVKYDPSEFHAEIEYNYSLWRYQLEHAQVLGLLDALGVNFNLGIIWNAIPWTFVIDWVLGVSRYLNERKVLNLEPEINIRRYLYSVKRRRLVLTQKKLIILESLSGPMNGYSVQLPTVVETAYRRVVDLPTDAQIQLSGLNPREFTLGAALVIAQRRRPRRLR
jgi:hypothetical protein